MGLAGTWLGRGGVPPSLHCAHMDSAGGPGPLSLYRAPHRLRGPCAPGQTRGCPAAASALQRLEGLGRAGSPGCRPAAGSCTSTCRPPRCAAHPRAPGRCRRRPRPRRLRGSGEETGSRQVSEDVHSARRNATPPGPPPSHFCCSNWTTCLPPHHSTGRNFNT